MTTGPESGRAGMSPPDRYQDLSRFRLPPGFRGRSTIVVQLWWIVQATLFGLSPQILYGWRRFLLRLFGAKIGRGVILRPSMRAVYPWKISIGDRSWIGDHVALYSLGAIQIGADTVVSQNSYLCTGSHDPYSLAFDITARPIRVGDECWIASGVFVAPGVTIGDGAVIGARSAVFGDMPAGMICYGNPALPVRARRAGDSADLAAGAATSERAG